MFLLASHERYRLDSQLPSSPSDECAKLTILNRIQVVTRYYRKYGRQTQGCINLGLYRDIVERASVQKYEIVVFGVRLISSDVYLVLILAGDCVRYRVVLAVHHTVIRKFIGLQFINVRGLEASDQKYHEHVSTDVVMIHQSGAFTCVFVAQAYQLRLFYFHLNGSSAVPNSRHRSKYCASTSVKQFADKRYRRSITRIEKEYKGML